MNEKIELVEAVVGSEYFDFALNLIFDEWGDGDLEHLKKKKESLRKDETKKCYVLEIDSRPVGCFVICENDIDGHPEYNPNLACVCIDKKFRGQGYSRILMEESNKVFKKLNIKKAYLKTDLDNLVGYIINK